MTQVNFILAIAEMDALIYILFKISQLFFQSHALPHYAFLLIYVVWFFYISLLRHKNILRALVLMHICVL
jgi:hypothetical protein